MKTSASSRLRDLARAHHAGEVDRDTYRKARANVLDRLDTGAEEPVQGDATIPRTALPAATVAADGRSGASRVREQSSIRGTPSRNPLLAWLGAPGVLAVAAAGWWIVDHPAGHPTGRVPVATRAEVPAERIIEAFEDARDWSDAAIAALNQRLAALPQSDLAAAALEPWYSDFVSQVRSEIKARRATAAAKGAPTAIRGALAALAATLQIDVASGDARDMREADAATAAESSRATVRDARSDSDRPKESVAEKATANTDAIAPEPASVKTSAPSPAGGTARVSAANSAAGAALTAARPVATAASAPAAGPQASATASSSATGNSAESCRRELAGTRRPWCRDALSSGGTGPALTVIAPGSFQMGSRESETEQPVTRVTLTKPFAISRFEVSQEEYKRFCAATNRAFPEQPWEGPDYPVVRVSWADARDYAAWLSQSSGARYRLPSEAEWEFAARGGVPGLYPSDTLNPTDAAFSTAAEQRKSPAPRSEKFNANAFSVFHAIGNVREWTEDAWTPNLSAIPADGGPVERPDAAQRAVRGGSFRDVAANLRFSRREPLPATTRDDYTGIRVLREL